MKSWSYSAITAFDNFTAWALFGSFSFSKDSAASE